MPRFTFTYVFVLLYGEAFSHRWQQVSLAHAPVSHLSVQLQRLINIICWRHKFLKVKINVSTLCVVYKQGLAAISSFEPDDCACACVCVQGEVIHWLACSLYAACRKGSTPTVGRGLMEGNCVSLTRILRTAKLRFEKKQQHMLSLWATLS